MEMKLISILPFLFGIVQIETTPIIKEIPLTQGGINIPITINADCAANWHQEILGQGSPNICSTGRRNGQTVNTGSAGVGAPTEKIISNAGGDNAVGVEAGSGRGGDGYQPGQKVVLEQQSGQTEFEEVEAAQSAGARQTTTLQEQTNEDVGAAPLYVTQSGHEVDASTSRREVVLVAAGPEGTVKQPVAVRPVPEAGQKYYVLKSESEFAVVPEVEKQPKQKYYVIQSESGLPVMPEREVIKQPERKYYVIQSNRDVVVPAKQRIAVKYRPVTQPQYYIVNQEQDEGIIASGQEVILPPEKEVVRNQPARKYYIIQSEREAQAPAPSAQAHVVAVNPQPEEGGRQYSAMTSNRVVAVKSQTEGGPQYYGLKSSKNQPERLVLPEAQQGAETEAEYEYDAVDQSNDRQPQSKVVQSGRSVVTSSKRKGTRTSANDNESNTEDAQNGGSEIKINIDCAANWHQDAMGLGSDHICGKGQASQGAKAVNGNSQYYVSSKSNQKKDDGVGLVGERRGSQASGLIRQDQEVEGQSRRKTSAQKSPEIMLLKPAVQEQKVQEVREVAPKTQSKSDALIERARAAILAHQKAQAAAREAVAVATTTTTPLPTTTASS